MPSNRVKCFNPACRVSVPLKKKGAPRGRRDKTLRYFCGKCLKNLTPEDRLRLYNYHLKGSKKARLPVAKCWTCSKATPQDCDYILYEKARDLPWIKFQVSSITKLDPTGPVMSPHTRCEYTGSFGYQPQIVRYAVTECKRYEPGDMPPISERGIIIAASKLSKLPKVNEKAILPVVRQGYHRAGKRLQGVGSH